MNNETWLPVVGYEGLYEVSSLGRVRSLARDGRKGRVLRPAKNTNGYLVVGLCKNGKQKTHKVHRLVATAFIPNQLGLPMINHKNERKDQNFVENLEWCDVAYNNAYGTRMQRIADALSIPVFQYDLDGAFVAWYPSANEAARRTGLDNGGIAMCTNGKCKTYAGYQWRYEPALFLDATDGRFNRADSKRVYQYDINGRFVKEWPSVSEVERQTGWSDSNIYACCNGKYKQRYGFRWFYSFQGYSLK